MKAAAYLRVSTAGQVGEDKFGLSAQREAIETFAMAEGYELVEFFIDEGISGAVLDRPALQDMIRGAGAKEFEFVITAKMDRIARDLYAQLWIEKELLKYDVEIISTAETFRGQDPANVLFRQMIGAFAEFEKSRIAERLKGGRTQKAKRGGYAGGIPCIGYKAVRGGKSLKQDREKIETVSRVFEIRNDNPGFTLQQIADVLNSEGHTTAQGKPFRKTQVKRILDREAFYQGRYEYAGITAPGQHKAILKKAS